LARKTFTLPLSPDQAERIRALRTGAAVLDCKVRAYPSEGRAPGTKTVVITGSLEQLRDLCASVYLFGYDPEPN